MTRHFVEPSELYSKSFVEALREGLFIEPWAEDEINAVENDFGAWRSKSLDLSKPVILPDGSEVRRVPQTTRWLIESGRFIGLCGVRHFLTESLESYGGHIGYALRISERKKGLGRLLLIEGLRIASELSLQDVVLTCNADNLPSIRLIESCGGNLERAVTLPFRDIPHNIYRITLAGAVVP